MIILKLIVSGAALIVQTLALKEMVSILKFVQKEGEKHSQIKTEEDRIQKNTHQEIPEWVGMFIDDYMLNSEKDID